MLHDFVFILYVNDSLIRRLSLFHATTYNICLATQNSSKQFNQLDEDVMSDVFHELFLLFFLFFCYCLKVKIGLVSVRLSIVRLSIAILHIC